VKDEADLPHQAACQVAAAGCDLVPIRGPYLALVALRQLVVLRYLEVARRVGFESGSPGLVVSRRCLERRARPCRAGRGRCKARCIHRCGCGYEVAGARLPGSPLRRSGQVRAGRLKF
jgi:hypothetical protein